MRTFIKLQYALVLFMCFNLSIAQGIKTVRIDFQNPDGYTRHLALGFLEDNSATDGVDYGYDAPYVNDLQDDLNWMIDDNRYIIQGVGAFNTGKYYPLGMFLINSGEVEISLNALESFDSEVDVYLYDLELGIYAQLNNDDLTLDMSAGNYVNRFFVTFSTNVHLDISNNYLLSIDDEKQSDVNVRYINETDQLHIDGLPSDLNSNITIYNIEGKKVKEEFVSINKTIVNTSEIDTGIYIVKIQTSSFTHTTKVCITK